MSSGANFPGFFWYSVLLAAILAGAAPLMRMDNARRRQRKAPIWLRSYEAFVIGGSVIALGITYLRYPDFVRWHAPYYPDFPQPFSNLSIVLTWLLGGLASLGLYWFIRTRMQTSDAPPFDRQPKKDRK